MSNENGHVVFVVDDSEPDRYLARYELETVREDVTVIECTDGPELLEALGDEQWLTSSRPIGVLLDINMPSLSGFDVLDEVQSNPELRRWVSQMCVFVMLTSSNNERDRQRAQSYPFEVGYFTKPLTQESTLELFEHLDAESDGLS